MRARLLTLALATMALLALPTAAFAYTPIATSDVSCVAGGDLGVDCSSPGWQAGSSVDVVVTASTLLDTTVTADADGNVAFSFDVPAGHADGDVVVTLTGTAADGNPRVLSGTAATIQDGAVIANAGAESLPIALFALGALAVGVTALLVSRRTVDDEVVA